MCSFFFCHFALDTFEKFKLQINNAYIFYLILLVSFYIYGYVHATCIYIQLLLVNEICIHISIDCGLLFTFDIAGYFSGLKRFPQRCDKNNINSRVHVRVLFTQIISFFFIEVVYAYIGLYFILRFLALCMKLCAKNE